MLSKDIINKLSFLLLQYRGRININDNYLLLVLPTNCIRIKDSMFVIKGNINTTIKVRDIKNIKHYDDVTKIYYYYNKCVITLLLQHRSRRKTLNSLGVIK